MGTASVAVRRRARQQEIVLATRALFDARGVRDANIDDIAKAVGINRTIIYRHVASKEELFVLTLAEYLADLGDRVTVTDHAEEHESQLKRFESLCTVFVEFCSDFPAFPECALSLMRTSGSELLAEIGEAALLALGRPMAALLTRLASVLEAGNESGEFAVSDPNLAATLAYTQILGMMHVPRLGLLVHETAPGVPGVSRVDPRTVQDQVIRACVATITAR